MPKELIHGDKPPYGTPDEPGPARSVVEVRWDRETGYFQIATKCIDAATGEDYRPPLREIEVPLTASGDLDSGKLTELVGEDMLVQSGWYVDLDRRGINELIRVLRRARDQAFGRDE